MIRFDTKGCGPKRSRVVPLALMGAAAFGMAACQDESVESATFPTKEECLATAGAADNWWTAEDCETNFAAALDEHERSAPRYADAALCEEEHEGACYEQPGSAGGGSIFLPLVAGYMMGNMLANTNASTRAQPIYRTASGQYGTANGTTMTSNRGVGQIAPAAFRAAPSTVSAAPMTRATVRSTGGFGSSRTSTGTRSLGG